MSSRTAAKSSALHADHMLCLTGEDSSLFTKLLFIIFNHLKQASACLTETNVRTIGTDSFLLTQAGASPVEGNKQTQCLILGF